MKKIDEKKNIQLERYFLIIVDYIYIRIIFSGVLNMNCCRALIVNLQKVFYRSQASVGDRQHTIILFISIIFLPTILNYLNDRERKRHYHFVGF